MSDVASELGVNVTVLKERLRINGYCLLGDMLVSEALLKRVEAELGKAEGATRSDVEEILRR
ncbi:MAG: hypothetical protein QXX87_01620, partial [Candidatus Jordarchaeales archaeon]